MTLSISMKWDTSTTELGAWFFPRVSEAAENAAGECSLTRPDARHSQPTTRIPATLNIHSLHPHHDLIPNLVGIP